MVRVFVDGQEGTTGLQIRDRLTKRSDIELLEIAPEKRKDLGERKRLLNEADFVFLCLPDDAARESVRLVENSHTRILDASTAHRTQPDWVYGLPELSKTQREAITKATRVAVPGCHATAFILSVAPLVQAGLIDAGAFLNCTSVTGYTGGGKKMIANYEDPNQKHSLAGPRYYALGLSHKHLPEMQHYTKLANPPAFFPIVGPFPQGLVTSVGFHNENVGFGAQKVHEALKKAYEGSKFVEVLEIGGASLADPTSLDPSSLEGTNNAELVVFGNEKFTSVYCRIDNLGKGASGAAVQCLNLMLGVDEGYSL